jgi:hypothetical protein
MVLALSFAISVFAQTPPPAVDVTAAAAKAFIDQLPKPSDRRYLTGRLP